MGRLSAFTTVDPKHITFCANITPSARLERDATAGEKQILRLAVKWCQIQSGTTERLTRTYKNFARQRERLP